MGCARARTIPHRRISGSVFYLRTVYIYLHMQVLHAEIAAQQAAEIHSSNQSQRARRVTAADSRAAVLKAQVIIDVYLFVHIRIRVHIHMNVHV